MTGTIELDPDGKTLQIRFPYRPDLVDDVKSIPGRRWDRAGKLWRVPAGQVENVIAALDARGKRDELLSWVHLSAAANRIVAAEFAGPIFIRACGEGTKAP